MKTYLRRTYSVCTDKSAIPAGSRHAACANAAMAPQRLRMAAVALVHSSQCCLVGAANFRRRNERALTKLRSSLTASFPQVGKKLAHSLDTHGIANVAATAGGVQQTGSIQLLEMKRRVAGAYPNTRGNVARGHAGNTMLHVQPENAQPMLVGQRRSETTILDSSVPKYSKNDCIAQGTVSQDVSERSFGVVDEVGDGTPFGCSREREIRDAIERSPRATRILTGT